MTQCLHAHDPLLTRTRHTVYAHMTHHKLFVNLLIAALNNAIPTRVQYPHHAPDDLWSSLNGRHVDVVGGARHRVAGHDTHALQLRREVVTLHDLQATALTAPRHY